VSTLLGLVPLEMWRVLRPSPTTGQIWFRQQLLREAYNNPDAPARARMTRDDIRREYWLLSREVAQTEFRLCARRICREHYRDLRRNSF